jgi:hypothetical protein
MVVLLFLGLAWTPPERISKQLCSKGKIISELVKKKDA